MATVEFLVVDFIAFGEQDVSQVAIRNQDRGAFAGEVDLVAAGIHVEAYGELGAGNKLLRDPVWFGVGIEIRSTGRLRRRPPVGAGLRHHIAESFGVA